MQNVTTDPSISVSPSGGPESAPATPSPSGSPPGAAGAPAPVYGWLFLAGLAVIFALINPLILGLQVRGDVTVGLLLAGGVVLALGLIRRVRLLTWAGGALLWTSIIGGTASQIAPLGLAPGTSWGPRGLLLLAAALGWLFFMRLPPWLLRGAIAAAIPTGITLALLWSTAPPYAHNAVMYWLAADSHGTVYASDVDNGFVWVFDSTGAAQGKLWPRRAAPGTPGPGFEPAGLGNELTLALARATPTPGGPTERELLFCGLAVDPQDHLYLVDPDLSKVRVFDRAGQVQAAWALPADYIPARGCLAADSTHVYVGDNHGIIYVYDHQGTPLAKWERDRVSLGLAAPQEGQVLVLDQTRVAVLAFPGGNTVREWPLPAPNGDLQVPYQGVTVRANGEVLITDLGTSQIRRYTPDGQELSSLGMAGGWPGQFAGLGGIATDPRGYIYAADTAFRVIERFRPDGQVDAIWLAPENEAGE